MVWLRLTGDTAPGVFYLMGNHTIAERMYRYRPAVMLYAPLHTMIWDSPDGTTKFTFDRPSDQFGSFGVPEIAQSERNSTTSWPRCLTTSALTSPDN